MFVMCHVLSKNERCVIVIGRLIFHFGEPLIAVSCSLDAVGFERTGCDVLSLQERSRKNRISIDAHWQDGLHKHYAAAHSLRTTNLMR